MSQPFCIVDNSVIVAALPTVDPASPVARVPITGDTRLRRDAGMPSRALSPVDCT